MEHFFLCTLKTSLNKEMVSLHNFQSPSSIQSHTKPPDKWCIPGFSNRWISSTLAEKLWINCPVKLDFLLLPVLLFYLDLFYIFPSDQWNLLAFWPTALCLLRLSFFWLQVGPVTFFCLCRSFENDRKFLVRSLF